MDEQTISVYDTKGAQYTKNWSEQPPPTDLYDAIREYFKPGPTVDIGCGSGRELVWLNANGYDASGYDASEGMLQHARTLYPHLRLGVATLPELAGVPAGAYENVLCETVIMHLPADSIGPAVRSLLKLLRPSGTMYLSWRVTKGESVRDENGRLYTAFDKKLAMSELGACDTVLLDKEDLSLSSGKLLHRLVVRRGSGQVEIREHTKRTVRGAGESRHRTVERNR